MLSCLRGIRLFVTPWTVVHQAPLFMKSSRQEYWSGLPFLLQGSSWPRHWTWVSWTNRWIQYHWATWEVHKILLFPPKNLRIVKTTMASPRTKSSSRGRAEDMVSSIPLESQVSSVASEFWKGVEGESQILPWRSGSPQILRPDPLSLAQASSWPLI